VDEDEVEVESFDEEMFFLFYNDEEMGSMPVSRCLLEARKMNHACVRLEPRCTTGPQSHFDKRSESIRGPHFDGPEGRSEPILLQAYQVMKHSI
jgi:hypothetical protein